MLSLSYIFKNHLNGQALDDYLKIWNVALPGILSPSKYLFKKRIPMINLDYQIHHYCSFCHHVVPDKEAETCADCGSRYSFKETDAKEKYFVTFPLKKQLINILRDAKNANSLIQKSQFLVNENVSDVCNGDYMRQMMADGSIRDTDFTLLCNWDGAAGFKSSTRSYWPVYATVNELPYSIRKKNMLMLGLWFGANQSSKDN